MTKAYVLYSNEIDRIWNDEVSFQRIPTIGEDIYIDNNTNAMVIRVVHLWDSSGPITALITNLSKS
ncbi:hypothetical protein [Photobacterium minamisatsumaniensis]|uniref:hypothetical protein n=1 Tax=Photobacterium minamisatsumaniensis TaxID=2910233 RepID=UPI003D12A8D7